MEKSNIYNNKYFISEIFKADKFRIPYDILVKTLQSIMGYILWIIAIKIILNAIIAGKGFGYVIICMVAYEIVEIIYIYIRSHYYEIYEPMSNNRINMHFQKKIFNQAKRVDISCYEDSTFYDKYIKITSDIKTRISGVINSLSSIISNIITLGTMSLVIFLIDPWIVLFILIPLFSTMILGKKQKKIRFNYDMEIAKISRRRDYVRRCFYLKDFSKEIKISKIENVLLEMFKKAIKDMKLSIKKYGIILGIIEYILTFSKDVICYLGACTYLGYIALVSKTLQMGDAFIVIDSIRRVAQNLQDIVDSYNVFISHSMYIENLRTFLEYEPKVVSELNLEVENNEETHLRFKNVSFKYNHKNEYALLNIDLDINKNEKIAIVGTNGAGKSTLVKLIMRLYDVSEGEILFNDRNIKDYNVKSYRNLFSSIFQDFPMFSFSILKNVLLKKEKLEDKDRAIEALKASGVYKRVKKSQNGINTILTKEFDDNGEVFSGGEFQKIALARVFAKDSKIVILDEPSSALDPIAEAKMYEKMLKACENKTVIFISHRLSSAVLADKIYLLDEGRIIEKGTHKELMDKKGVYAEMFNVQSKYYKDENALVEVMSNGN